MPRLKLSDELKTAITKLTSKEKDKLLFRLVALKPELAAQLEFILLEGGETTDERRSDMVRELTTRFEKMRGVTGNGLAWDMRFISGDISAHVKTTKDKYGEVYLNFFMLAQCVERFGNLFMAEKPAKQAKVNEYIAQRALRTLKQMVKLEQDYHLDFRAMRNTIGSYFENNPFAQRAATDLGLNLEWLITSDATPRGLV